MVRGALAACKDTAPALPLIDGKVCRLLGAPALLQVVIRPFHGSLTHVCPVVVLGRVHSSPLCTVLAAPLEGASGHVTAVAWQSVAWITAAQGTQIASGEGEGQSMPRGAAWATATAAGFCAMRLGLGNVYLSPALESNMGLRDTCGVHVGRRDAGW